MKKLGGFLKYCFDNFGPAVVFYVVNHFWGLRPAVISSLVFTAIAVAEKRWRGETVTDSFKFFALMAVVFGGLDLYLNQSVFFKYEAAVTNLVTAGFFAVSLRGEKSLIQEFAAPQIKAKGGTMTPEHVVFFRMWTMIWSAYFVLKAGAYAWIASRYSLEQTMLIRGVVGNVTMCALLGASIFLSKPIFRFLKDRGLLNAPQPQTVSA